MKNRKEPPSNFKSAENKKADLHCYKPKFELIFLVAFIIVALVSLAVFFGLLIL
jgi:hypothetical protein